MKANYKNTITTKKEMETKFMKLSDQTKPKSAKEELVVLISAHNNREK